MQSFAVNIGRRTRRQCPCFRTEMKTISTGATVGENPSAKGCLPLAWLTEVFIFQRLTTTYKLLFTA
ncbi:MAG: hypothetical protein LBP87_03840, partial [Planctomycetaceae bacterium]|nr:hypothetical protein [Planctomycetaceae bacterium]